MKIQCVEACILGSLCFIGMLIFGFPYAAPVSVLVGVTALIPVFGALIGCVIGAFLIFMINPIRSITFIIYFLILIKYLIFIKVANILLNSFFIYLYLNH